MDDYYLRSHRQSGAEKIDTITVSSFRAPEGSSFVFIGGAREKITAEALIRESIHTGDKEIIENLIEHSAYYEVDFKDPETFKHFAEQITEQEKI